VTGWFFYLGEIALKRLQNRVLLYRYGENSNSSNSYSKEERDLELRQSVSEFDLQLEQWYVSSCVPGESRTTFRPMWVTDYLTPEQDALSPTSHAVFSHII
jgi:hypothetical protein